MSAVEAWSISVACAMGAVRGIDNFVTELKCQGAVRSCLEGSSVDQEVQTILDDARLLIKDLNCNFVGSPSSPSPFVDPQSCAI
ncbi:hypothetical protein RHMOL_Rhmol02G0012200 [Rhododendron molle]|uniref:Uncharacterized protein n=1 Tax=Rhododendron molle TaxID=49168 RepID=A0ACC0PLQ2_RHOML|nr:hypothetical protein RHMOL_Rhmol02G0012200 [Rhododendron molle]